MYIYVVTLFKHIQGTWYPKVDLLTCLSKFTTILHMWFQ